MMASSQKILLLLVVLAVGMAFMACVDAQLYPEEREGLLRLLFGRNLDFSGGRKGSPPPVIRHPPGKRPHFHPMRG
ncbi:unnamed protein product [Cyprideis torosa]|uniref:Uncharacterized protein n=1 Tax=Cyprideis torosa TaxID=163714 RepID=A0A7R8ZL35_9CRUS|nr:unnamed protein product [Cyprideis torosa]CAG0885771.1 unnamed protein product [Cyprideis torosa]